MKRLIVFNGEALVGGMPVGIHRYEYEILKRIDLLNINSNIKIELLIPSNCEFRLKFKNIKIVKYGVVHPNFLSKLFWQQVIMPFYVKKNNAEGVDMTLALPVVGFKYISMHDCICESYPENYSTKKERMGRVYHFLRTKLITKKKSIKILTLSNFSKGELIKYYGNNIWEKIFIIPCGWEHMKEIDLDDSIFNILSKIERGNYFFSIGSKYRHKNFKWIIEVAKRNPEKKFVISGSNSVSTYYKELGNLKPENVIFTGYITNEQVKSLINSCKALIQPSIYEGFGLPPLEALSLGKEVLVAESSCFPEIYQDAVHYFDPYDYEVNIDQLLESKKIDADKVLKKNSWENASMLFWNLLNQNEN